MELAEWATMAFIASGISYNAVKCWRSAREIKLAKEYPVSLVLRGANLPEACRTAVVMVFDRKGNLLRKYPEAEISRRKTKVRLVCGASEGVLNFCALFAAGPVCLSKVNSRTDVDRLRTDCPDLLVAETGCCEVSGAMTLELKLIEDSPLEEAAHAALPASLAECLPVGMNTDAMAKELCVDLTHCPQEWEAGHIHYDRDKASGWLTTRRHGGKLLLQLRTNFDDREREAQVELRTGGEVCLLKVKQQQMGECAALTVSARQLVTPGIRNEVLQLAVTPEDESVQWQLKGGSASDGGCWWSVYPQAKTLLTGGQTFAIHLEAKPANVRSRSLVLTLEAGTYPFCRTTEVQVTQGVCFDYYIEYPLKDVCARHAGVIETPLDYRTGDVEKRYTVCVQSNQEWHIVRDESADWVEVSQPERLPGMLGGRFTVTVAPNTENRVKNGVPAARHTVLSLVNETGIVKDILVYQGGYVRINGICWMDRNLEAEGKLTGVAIPLGLPVGSTGNRGGYFQFGSDTTMWQRELAMEEEDWYDGTEENPKGKRACDPSPAGWRVPSRLEVETLINRQPALVEGQKGDLPTDICLMSDDGIPVFLPLCGHRSHINGCRIDIPRGSRYWCGTSQSAIYGYSYCVETNRQVSVMHDLKKYGFPVRCVLDVNYL